MFKVILTFVAAIFLASSAFANGQEVAAPTATQPSTQQPALQASPSGIGSVLSEKYAGDNGERTCHAITAPLSDDQYVLVIVLLPVTGNEDPNGGNRTPTYVFEAGIDPASARLSPDRWVLGVQDCAYGTDGRSTRFQVGTKYVENYHVGYFAASVPFTKEQVTAKAPLHTQLASGLYTDRWQDPAKMGGQQVVMFMK